MTENKVKNVVRMLFESDSLVEVFWSGLLAVLALAQRSNTRLKGAMLALQTRLFQGTVIEFSPDGRPCPESLLKDTGTGSASQKASRAMEDVKYAAHALASALQPTGIAIMTGALIAESGLTRSDLEAFYGQGFSDEAAAALTDYAMGLASLADCQTTVERKKRVTAHRNESSSEAEEERKERLAAKVAAITELLE